MVGSWLVRFRIRLDVVRVGEVTGQGWDWVRSSKGGDDGDFCTEKPKKYYF